MASFGGLSVVFQAPLACSFLETDLGSRSIFPRRPFCCNQRLAVSFFRAVIIWQPCDRYLEYTYLSNSLQSLTGRSIYRHRRLLVDCMRAECQREKRRSLRLRRANLARLWLTCLLLNAALFCLLLRL